MSFDPDLTSLDPRVIEALLAWQMAAGVDEAMSEEPVDRFALYTEQQEAQAARATEAPIAATPERRGAPPVPQAPAPVKVDPVAEARRAAAAASDLAALSATLQAFPHCDLKRGARNFLFAEGTPGARVMWITDPPGAAEDKAGRLMAGPSAGLFAKMLGAIGLDPDESTYLAPLMPWPNRAGRGTEEEVTAMMVPFLRRHIELAAPEVIVLAGNQVVQALLGKSGILSLRGTWTEIMGRPALISLPPGILLQNTYLKRGSWEDLLALQARLRS